MHMVMCMSSNARMVVLMSPKEKASLEAKAKRAGRISAGELVRRAVSAYDIDSAAEEAELRALLDRFAVTHEETLRRLDATERKLDETLASLQRMRSPA